MPMDNWYDLAIRELSDLTDLAKEKWAEAEQSLREPAPEALDEETPEPPAVVPRRPRRADEDLTSV